MSAPVKVSDLFAAKLENLKRRSEESDRRIAEHLKKLHQHLDEMKAIELDTVTDWCLHFPIITSDGFL